MEPTLISFIIAGIFAAHGSYASVCSPSPCEFSGTCITPSGSCNCTSADFSGPTCGTFLDQLCPHTAVANKGSSYVHVTVPDLRSRTSLVFAVKACLDAHLSLSSTQDFKNNMVEIVIGANNNAYITFRSCHLGCDLGYVAGTYLNCSAYRTFWVTWNTTFNSTNYVTTVRLGLGKQLGVGRVMTKTLGSLPNVSHMGVASYLSVNLVYWVFDYPDPTNTNQSCLQTTTTGAETTPSTTTAPPISTETPTGATTLATTALAETTTSKETTAAETTALPTATRTTTTTTPLTTSTPTGTSTTPTSAAQSTVSSAKMAAAVKKCTCRQVKVMTQAEAATAKAAATETAAEMKKDLTVDVAHTSAYIRTKVSTSDQRQSAQNLGALGVVMLTAVLSLVVVPDLLTLTAYVRAKLHSATWRRQAEREGRGATPTARASQSEQEDRGKTGGVNTRTTPASPRFSNDGLQGGSNSSGQQGPLSTAPDPRLSKFLHTKRTPATTLLQRRHVSTFLEQGLSRASQATSGATPRPTPTSHAYVTHLGQTRFDADRRHSVSDDKATVMLCTAGDVRTTFGGNGQTDSIPLRADRPASNSAGNSAEMGHRHSLTDDNAGFPSKHEEGNLDLSGKQASPLAVSKGSDQNRFLSSPSVSSTKDTVAV